MGRYYSCFGNFGGHGGFGGMAMMLIATIIIIAIVLIIVKNRSKNGSNREILKMLDERFAKGEINEEEYTAKKKVLSGK